MVDRILPFWDRPGMTHIPRRIEQAGPSQVICEPRGTVIDRRGIGCTHHWSLPASSGPHEASEPSDEVHGKPPERDQQYSSRTVMLE
jgi:hypothetical protein